MELSHVLGHGLVALICKVARSKGELIIRCKTEPLFLYGPIKSKIYSFNI